MGGREEAEAGAASFRAGLTESRRRPNSRARRAGNDVLRSYGATTIQSIFSPLSAEQSDLALLSSMSGSVRRR